MLLMKESVLSLREKQQNIGFPVFKMHASYFKYFLTDLLYILFMMISVYDY